MAKPLRFRISQETWSEDRVRQALYRPLDTNLGATMGTPWYREPDGYTAVRFDMDNGDLALFAWNQEQAYWLGNTETPSALWRTDKAGFEDVPYPIARWSQRELLAQLHQEAPWLADYPHISWYFLPVFLSKDGRRTSRAFFNDHAAGFPDASRDDSLAFLETTLKRGDLDPYRSTMAGKLGTSESLDLGRMTAAIGEFTAARLLLESGYAVTPEIEVTTGHSLDFRVDPTGVLVEVTRPLPPHRRTADSPQTAIQETASIKHTGQLAKHGGGAVLFIDCSSFPPAAWHEIPEQPPDIDHRPTVLYRARPSGEFTGIELGSVPLELSPLTRNPVHV